MVDEKDYPFLADFMSFAVPPFFRVTILSIYNIDFARIFLHKFHLTKFCSRYKLYIVNYEYVHI